MRFSSLMPVQYSCRDVALQRLPIYIRRCNVTSLHKKTSPKEGFIQKYSIVNRYQFYNPV